MGSGSSRHHRRGEPHQADVMYSQSPYQSVPYLQYPPQANQAGSSYQHPPQANQSSSSYQYPPQTGQSYPSYQTPEPGAPPTGYPPKQQPDAADLDPSGDWDQDRDQIYMRVLSADEFLGRMEETDEEVKTLSQEDDRQTHLPRITELMGLRGHLQDELLRIETMLSEHDPELKCLDQFAASHHTVVTRLREINQRAKVISTVPIPLQLETWTSEAHEQQKSGSDLSRSLLPGTSQRENSTGCQADVKGQSHDLAVQVTDKGEGHSIEVKDTEVTEEELKEKHDQEEHIVAKNFAQRIVKRPDLPPEEIEKILGDHLTSMQALRSKQQLEKDRFNERLEDKKRERLLKRRAAKQSGNPEDHDEISGDGLSNSGDSGVRSCESGRSNSSGRPEAGFSSEDFDGEVNTERTEMTKTLTDDLWSGMQKKMTQEDFRSVLDAFRVYEEKYTDQQLEKMRHDDAIEAKLRARKISKQNKSSTFVIGKENGSSTDPEVSHLDESFLASHPQSRRQAMTDKEYSDLVRRHLEDVRRAREQREAQDEELNRKMREKLRKHGGTDEDVEDEDEKIESMTKAVDDLDSSLVDALVSKKRLSDAAIQEILERHHSEQQQLLSQREAARQQMNEKIKQKLNEKKSQPKVERTDDDLYRELQEMREHGGLDADTFSRLLHNYLSQTAPRPARRKRSDGREVASSLVTEHEAKTKELQTIRHREKARVDDALRNKLEAKRRAKVQSSENSD